MASGYDLPPDTPGFAEAQAKYAKLSKQASALPGAVLDVPYGAHPRQKLDLFPAAHKAPAILFLRGGFWKVGSKDERRYPALAWHPRGVTWIVANYRLAPEFTLPEIVEDARLAVRWVLEHSGDHGVDADNIHLVGNSAGAHLAAMIAAEEFGERLKSLTLISGLFDLEPLRHASANEWLNMDADMARQMSPIHRLPPSRLPVTVCVGGAETAEFKEQSELYALACQQNGNPTEVFESPGRHHIGIIGECGEPGTPVFRSLEKHIVG